MVETRQTSRRLQAKASSSPVPLSVSSQTGHKSNSNLHRTVSILSREKKLQDVKELAQEIPIVMTDEKENEKRHVEAKTKKAADIEIQSRKEQGKTLDQEKRVEKEKENESVVVEKSTAVVPESTLVQEPKGPTGNENQTEGDRRASGASKDETSLLDDRDDNEADIEEEQDDKAIDYYAFLAAKDLNLPRKSAPTATPSVSATPTSVLPQQLVPTQLDSGASQYQEFFDFKGSKRSQAATLRADARAAEESKVLAAGQRAVAHSDRQRAESQYKKSAGRRWFNFESEEMTDDARRDFALLRMRNYLDPKKFYKSSDHLRALPRYFQMGTVIEGAHEFYSARLTKKQRRKTFTDELMADEAVVQYTNRVAGNIQKARSTQGRQKRRHY